MAGTNEPLEEELERERALEIPLSFYEAAARTYFIQVEADTMQPVERRQNRGGRAIHQASEEGGTDWSMCPVSVTDCVYKVQAC